MRDLPPGLGEKILRALTDNAVVGIGQMSADLKLIYANNTMLRWCEVESFDEIAGEGFKKFIAPETLKLIERQMRDRLEGRAASYEFELISRSGKRKFLQISSVPAVGDDGEVRSSIATLVDVTPLKLANSRVESILESLDFGLMAIDANDRVLFCNRLFIDQWKIPPDMAERGDNREFMAHALGQMRTNQEFMARRQQLLASGVGEFNHLSELKDGRYFEHSNKLFRDNASGIARLVVTRDVTERKRFEQRLVHADRMASVGTLAAGIAHEINNPLTHVAGGLELLYERLRALDPKGERDELADVYKLMDLMLRSSSRIAEIVGDLKMFSRSDDARVMLMDVNEAIDSTLPLVESHARHRARIVREGTPVPPVRANPNRLGQVLLNLVLNAAQAIPEGKYAESRITIRTRAIGNTVVIEVADTGEGIPPEIQSRIFEPFFTTKPVGTGTGLRLFISYNIIRAMGGDIEVESSEGKGSLFRICLPAAQPEPSRPGAEPVTKPAAGREKRVSGRLLLVDDEEAITSMLSAALESDHVIVTACSGEEALKKLEGPGPGFDLILCDLMMPGMDGMQLYNRAISKWPELDNRWAFITGGAVNPEIRAFVQRTTRPVLHKPFSLKVIREFVRSSLEF